MLAQDINNFSQIIKRVDPKSNPFSCSTISNIKANDLNNIQCEFIIRKDVRCPICFHLVILGARPNSCFHVYCRHCLNKWANLKKTCPYCRKSFTKILCVSLTEDWIDFQGKLFAKY